VEPSKKGYFNPFIIRGAEDFNPVFRVGVAIQEQAFMDVIGTEIWRTAIDMVAQQVANHIMENHLPEIMDKISVQAIANMSVAQAGAEINTTLKRELPQLKQAILNTHQKEIIRETQVYEKGFFGGVRRIS
jgi:hypothetical protein